MFIEINAQGSDECNDFNKRMVFCHALIFYLMTAVRFNKAIDNLHWSTGSREQVKGTHLVS